MPRKLDDSRFRRFMMQGIMWIVLGATVGLAALVDHQKRSAKNVQLGEPQQFEGFSIRLPLGWDHYEEFGGRSILVSLENSKLDDQLVIMLRKPAAEPDAKAADSSDDRVIERIAFGEDRADLVVYQEFFKNRVENVLSVSREMPGGRILLIAMKSPYSGPRVLNDLKMEIDLLKRMAASLEVEKP